MSSTPLSTWFLTVKGPDVPGGSFNADLDTLKDWRDIPALRFSSSPGIYTTSFNLDTLPLGPSALELGWVMGAAEVKVNGKPAGTALIPPFSVPLDGLLLAGRNEIEVKVVPALRNRLIGYGRRNPEYKNWKGKEDMLLATGLIGPARVVISEK